LTRIAGLNGKGSSEARRRELKTIFARATAPEQEFLAHLLYGELRQGALEGLMADAIARAASIPLTTVRRAVMACGDLATAATLALTEGESGIARVSFELFRAIPPMLAQPIDDPEAALARLGGAALLEYKLDGARIQVHRSGEEVRIFSRHLREITPALPEIVQVARRLPVREVILDGEALALRPDGRPHPFQTTMRRFGRKGDPAELRHELPLTPFFFDVLLLDGELLIDRPLEERAELLQRKIGHVVPQARAGTTEEADAFLSEALRAGHEGAMAKSLRAGYDAGGRGFAWLKLKAAHTLDLVILAAEWGNGRRRGWLSNLHLGARDEGNAGFVMLGKTFKGLTDAMLEWQTRELLARELGRDANTVYVRPELVAEVAFNNVQTSPQYPAGLALRFARIKRFRDDKSAAEADTIEEVRRIHAREHGLGS
jgi:DNA ligase-1